MNVSLGVEAKRDLNKISQNLRIEITRELEKLRDNPLPDNSYVIQLPDGKEIQCLKLQEEYRNSDLNHRVTYDILGDIQLRVYGIFHRKPGYSRIKKETQNRL